MAHINILNRSSDVIPFDSIPIYRPHVLGNPFSHLSSRTRAEFKVATVEEAVSCFEVWLQEKLRNYQPDVCDAMNVIAIRHLKNVRKDEDSRSETGPTTDTPLNLVCCCAPKPCHGSIIKKIIETSYKRPRNWFSNMAILEKPIIYQGISFPSVENFYQAMKLDKKDVAGRKLIASLAPHQAKKEIRKMAMAILPEALEAPRRIAVMSHSLSEKFAGGTSWYNRLLHCKGEIVEHNNWGDTFFGRDIYTGEGKNVLGILLMMIREQIGGEPCPVAPPSFIKDAIWKHH